MGKARTSLTSHNRVYLRCTAVVAGGEGHEQDHVSGSTAQRGGLSQHPSVAMAHWVRRVLARRSGADTRYAPRLLRRREPFSRWILRAPGARLVVASGRASNHLRSSGSLAIEAPRTW